MKKKILITGVAGFIGFSFALKLLENNHQVIGLDNLDSYYSVKLKKKRLKKLNKFKKFSFFKINIEKKNFFEKLRKKKIDHIFHFAAQAGVRYSVVNPKKYVYTNILGTINVFRFAVLKKIKSVFFASSSSVYGENNNFPLNEKENIFPKNIYGLSKKVNEEIGFIFNKYYNVKLIGLRFFTVFGEWGRPDMMMFKFIDSYYKNKLFNLNNYGNHSRDFTYIGDVVNILYLLLKKHKKLKNFDLLNICSNKPVNLKEVISFMKKNKINPRIKKVSLQKADILKTHGDNSKLLKFIKYKKFSNWRDSLKKTIIWYQKNII